MLTRKTMTMTKAASGVAKSISTNSFGRSAVVAAALAALLAAGGCATPSVRPATSPVPLAAAFSASGETAAPALWWTVFGDAQLDALEGEALAGNLDLRGAWARLSQAEAGVSTADAARRPTLQLGGGGSRSEQETGSARVSSGRVSGFVGASYEVDLWGRLAAGSSAAEGSRVASAQDLRAAAVSLSAQVADAWYRTVSLRARLAVQESLRATNAQQLDLLDLGFRKGQNALSDLTQQQELVASNAADVLALRRQLDAAELSLAVLLGQAPTGYVAPAGAVLPTLPALPQVGTPATVLLQRPDVQAALARLQAADWQVAAAVTNRLPSLSLSLDLSTSAATVGGFMETWLAQLAADLALPVMDGGRRRAEVSRSQAAAAERYWSFGQTLLEAWQEVEVALRNEASQAALVRQLEAQLAISGEATAQIRARYSKGAASFNAYLTQLKSYQRLQLQVEQQRLVQVQDRIALHRAIAGGWPLDAPAAAPGRTEHFLLGAAADSGSVAAPSPDSSNSTDSHLPRTDTP